MIEVKVERVVVYNNSDLIVLLRGNDERVLPIHVDEGQAQAIDWMLKGLTFPRPLTHDLMKSVVDALGGRLLRVEVSDLIAGTFFARLVLVREGKEHPIDARPSDAIALALRCSAPIFVDGEVMREAGVVVPAEHEGEKKTKKLSAAELAELKLEQAVAEERYEDAAELRDELKRLKENKTSN